MRIALNTGLQVLLWTDDEILKYLDICEREYKQGNLIALFQAIVVCAKNQAVIPEWASIALLDGQKSLQVGELKDFNQLFGWELLSKEVKNQATRRKEAKLLTHAKAVLEKLFDYRLKNGSLNAAEAFQPVADELEISQRDVKEIYSKYGKFLKNIPKGSKETHGFMFGSPEIPPRRTGRRILVD